MIDPTPPVAAGPTVSPPGPRLVDLRSRLHQEVGKVVVGQGDALDALLAALAAGGHVLLEGVPGVAKTLLAATFARALGLEFRRAQFTPDLLPSDLTGTMTLRDRELVFRPGPVFTNVLLADEINRTPPKTQAALLEAMQEQQVTIDGDGHRLPDPFLVVATQNPIEYEGTYPLPEAQLDRFLVKVVVGYPSVADEQALLGLARHGLDLSAADEVRPVISASDIAAARAEVDATMVSADVAGYVSAIVRQTRTLPSVEVGASPRAGVHLLVAAKAAARLGGRAFVTPDDVVRVATMVLRHRLVLRPEAELERFTPEAAIANAIAAVPVPR
ncbi:MAG: MoxR family ATPase [Acidimicrobiales bacterium]|nr:MoxR family ATPase [Acidimicrobiales bacterium]